MSFLHETYPVKILISLLKTNKISSQKTQTLSCKYVRHHASLIIAPVKQELAYDNPPLWIYHDIITDKQIETLKLLSTPKVFHFYILNLDKNLSL